MNLSPNQQRLFDKYKPELERLCGAPITIDKNHIATIGKFGAWEYMVRCPDPIKRWANLVSCWIMTELPGCCGACVSLNAIVYTSYEGKGIGTILNKLRIDMAREDGYGLLICTDEKNNEHQRRILAKNGWKDVDEWVNPRTTHTVKLSAIHL